MSETIIPAKRYQRIWEISGGSRYNFNLIDVVAWAVGSSGHPIPITVMGRLDKNAEYVLGTDTGWILLPSGHAFHDSLAVGEYLRSRDAG